ncbi:MAG: hypothetical protein L0H53_05260 [Candidatus Nitrosocosmicus sp.]|nr:hypothetical protein [Candidatus Nitrosocosmicus sp.]MDN5867292.1 hypothetical protein [Candidatus Nitrosocosmicus sp.]
MTKKERYISNNGLITTLINNSIHGYLDIFGNQTNFHLIFLIFSLLLLFGIVLLYFLQSLPIAFGHTTKQFGNLTVEAGWLIEPPLVDEINSIIILVHRQNDQSNDTSENVLAPVRNALSQINVVVKYGGITKQLNFVPSVETAGGYVSSIIPSRIGSYDVLLNGTISGQNINAEIPIEDIEGKQNLIFPPAEDSVSGVESGPQDSANSAIIGSNLRAILSGLENNIRTNADVMNSLINSTQRLQESLNEQIIYLNSLYMVSVSSIGIGIGAIIISAFALKRKKV